MSKKPAKAKKAKVKDKKPKAPIHGIGHNSGGKVIPQLRAMVDETLHLDEQIKALNKAKRDVRNRAKTEFGVLSSTWAHEMRLRKLDPDVRVQFESSHDDLKIALGYQPELPFESKKPLEKDLPPKDESDDENPDDDEDDEDPDVINRAG